jgi:hypothetical protein
MASTTVSNTVMEHPDDDPLENDLFTSKIVFIETYYLRIKRHSEYGNVLLINICCSETGNDNDNNNINNIRPCSQNSFSLE